MKQVIVLLIFIMQTPVECQNLEFFSKNCQSCKTIDFHYQKNFDVLEKIESRIPLDSLWISDTVFWITSVSLVSHRITGHIWSNNTQIKYQYEEDSLVILNKTEVTFQWETLKLFKSWDTTRIQLLSDKYLLVPPGYAYRFVRRKQSNIIEVECLLFRLM
jgi:hypothetical protein